MDTPDNGGMENVDSENTAIDHVEQSTSDHKDMSLGMKIFGVLEILGGVMSMLVVILGVFVILLMNRSDFHHDSLFAIWIYNIVIYSVFAILLIWIGIGSFRCRRWARAICVANGWLALVLGVITTFSMPFIMGEWIDAMQSLQAFRAGSSIFFKAMFFVFALFSYVIVPLIFLLFYTNRNTRRTCEMLDPKERWTDRIPMPVLVLIVAAFYGLFGVFSGLMLGGLFPFFGKLLTGFNGAIPLLIMAGILLLAVRDVYKLRMFGWWIAISMIIIFYSSAYVTFLKIELIDIYAAIPFTKSMLDMYRSVDLPSMSSSAWPILVVMACAIVFMLWIRRYFKQEYKDSLLTGKVGANEIDDVEAE